MINRLQADRMAVALGAAAAEKLAPILSAQPELQPQVDMPSPLKLEIRETVVRQMDIFWGANAQGAGAIRATVAKFYPDGPALNGLASEGTLEQTGWPKLRILRVETHYAKPQLEIRSAHFAIGKDEDIAAQGQFEFDEGVGGAMRLQVQAKKAPAEPFLKGFWRGKFEGEFDGDTQIEKKFAPGATATAAGELQFLQAEVHDVATLDRVAALTRHPEFAQLKLNELRGRYKWTGARLEVSELRLEAKKLIRIEGEFVIEDEEIHGKFQMGATADVLDSIPGAREKVFTEARDGYFWTSMKLSGPLKHPHEDLKQRLVAAAEEELGKGFLAPLFKPGKVVLGLLNALYQ